METAEGAALPVDSNVARWTLIASILGSSMAFIDGSVVNVALPSIQADLGGGLATQQWVVDAYLLTLGSLILVGGSLGDIFGESKVFAIGVASFAGASILCALAPDAPALIVFRAIQGMAGAVLTPASLAMITATYTGTARGNAIGQWTSWTGISFILGPTLGGWLVDVSSWRLIFLINIPIAAATLLILRRLGGMHQKRREDLRVDVVGAILGTAGLGLLVAGFIEQPQLGWGDPLILGALIGGTAILGAFVAYELRTPMPMLPLRLFRLRNFSVTNIETLSVYGGLSALTTFLTLYLIEFAGFSALRAGISLLPVTVVMFFLSPRMGRLSMQYGPRLFMSLGPVIAGLGVLAYTRLPQDVSYWADIFPALLVFALGLSMTVAPLTTTVLADAGPGDAGVASGVNNAVARIAGLLAIAILGILAAGGGDHLTVHGFHATMGAVSALLVCGGLIGAVGIRNPSHA
ncbi:MAG TPA: MFS transporter [Gaiellaceae bacterium]|jgi:EmrB/QacA subfamily drug resistance transporter